MTAQEFSDAFDTKLNSLNYKDAFNEYEKSVFLTEAQNEIFLALYNTFEQSEKSRRALANLLDAQDIAVTESDKKTVTDTTDSYKVTIDTEGASYFILRESATVAKQDTCKHSYNVTVVPVKRDELNYVLANPFKSPNGRRVLRVDIAPCMVSIYVNNGYLLNDYHVELLKCPTPIVTVNLDSGVSINGYTGINDGSLASFMDDDILNLAITKAINSKANRAHQSA